MIKKSILICMALSVPFFLVACGSGPEKKKSETDEEYRRRRASDSVTGYDGKPIVSNVSRKPRPVKIKYNENPRYLVYVGEGRSRVRAKKAGPGASRIVSKKYAKSFVITDGSALEFTENYKKSDYRNLRGGVQTVSMVRFDEIVSDLTGKGFNRLDGEVVKTGEKAVGTTRSFHLEVDGQRKSIYKEKQQALGSQVSPRAIFTHCELYMIKLFEKKR